MQIQLLLKHVQAHPVLVASIKSGIVSLFIKYLTHLEVVSKLLLSHFCALSY